MLDYWIPPRAVIGKGDGSGGSGGGATLKSKITAYYDLTPGATLTDAVAGNNLTNNGVVTFVAGGTPSGYAQFVAASSQSLTAADNAAISCGGDRAEMGWGWFNLASNSTGALMSQWQGTDTSYLIYVTALGLNTLFRNAANTTSFATTAISIALSTPTFYCWWYDPAIDTVYIEINASGSPQSVVVAGGLNDSGSIFALGQNSGTNFWDGQQTRVGRGHFLPTLTERQHLYNAGAGRIYSAITI